MEVGVVSKTIYKFSLVVNRLWKFEGRSTIGYLLEEISLMREK